MPTYQKKKVIPTSTRWEFHPVKAVAHLLNLLLYPIPTEEPFAKQTLGNIFQENNDNPTAFAEIAGAFLTEEINKSGVVDEITCTLSLTDQPLDENQAIYTLSILNKDNKNMFSKYRLIMSDTSIRLEEEDVNY